MNRQQQYTVISDFKAGLDRRKSVLTSVAGAMYTLENAHVNQGGEVEKRRAFVADATVFPSNTYGLEVVDTGFVTFGSDAAEGGSLPTGVTYQRLRHPGDLYGTYDANYHAMTSVVFSCNYNGKAFVCAKFADTKRFLYYNGTLVPQSWEGLVLFGLTGVDKLATQLETGIERETDGWTADSNVAANGEVNAYTPQGVYTNPAVDYTSPTGGAIAAQSMGVDEAGVTGTSARVAFGLSTLDAVDTFTIVGKTLAGANITLASAIPAAATAALTITALINAVNQRTSITGYYAQVVDGVPERMLIFAEAALGDSMNAKTVTVSCTGTTTITGYTGQACIVNGFVSVPVGVVYGSSETTGVSTVPTVSVVGGTAPYTYLWEEESAGSGNGITILGAETSQPTFTCYMIRDTTVNGTFKLTITDDASVEGVVHSIAVSLKYING